MYTHAHRWGFCTLDFCPEASLAVALKPVNALPAPLAGGEQNLGENHSARLEWGVLPSGNGGKP